VIHDVAIEEDQHDCGAYVGEINLWKHAQPPQDLGTNGQNYYSGKNEAVVHGLPVDVDESFHNDNQTQDNVAGNMDKIEKIKGTGLETQALEITLEGKG
jgi:hypothetical protein